MTSLWKHHVQKQGAKNGEIIFLYCMFIVGGGGGGGGGGGADDRPKPSWRDKQPDNKGQYWGITFIEKQIYNPEVYFNLMFLFNNKFSLKRKET